MVNEKCTKILEEIPTGGTLRAKWTRLQVIDVCAPERSQLNTSTAQPLFPESGPLKYVERNLGSIMNTNPAIKSFSDDWW